MIKKQEIFLTVKDTCDTEYQLKAFKLLLSFFSRILFSILVSRLMQKQLAYILGRQQIFLELDEDIEEYDELVEIISNAHLNNNFLALAREVWVMSLFPCLSPRSKQLM